jgi:folate-binding protein YgfZ
MTRHIANLTDRALIVLSGIDAGPWLQGLVTQSVDELAQDQLVHAALLTPQGKLLADFLVLRRGGELWLDVAASQRDSLIQRLSMYRLRAQVSLAPSDIPVIALWGGESDEGLADPRLVALGRRLYGPVDTNALVDDYTAHRRSLGVAEVDADGLAEKVYPVEANYDLLNGIDFRKGCFVGQETTSRMKRRGTVKSRILTIRTDGKGSELLNGDLRAGEVLALEGGLGLALVRLDRIAGAITLDGAPVELVHPSWLPAWQDNATSA